MTQTRQAMTGDDANMHVNGPRVRDPRGLPRARASGGGLARRVVA
jgi:hypothetical protein